MELRAANGHMWLTLPSTAACSARTSDGPAPESSLLPHPAACLRLQIRRVFRHTVLRRRQAGVRYAKYHGLTFLIRVREAGERQFVKGDNDTTVVADAAHKQQMDFTVGEFFFILTFIDIRCVTVED